MREKKVSAFFLSSYLPTSFLPPSKTYAAKNDFSPWAVKLLSKSLNHCLNGFQGLVFNHSSAK